MTALYVLYLIVYVLAVIGLWKTFVKAGEEGWKAIIPIWNLIVLLRIIGKPIWWIILLLIPLVNIVVGIIMMNELSKSFGRGVGFTVGLILLNPIFIIILGFGSDTYLGQGGPGGAGAPATI